MRKVLLAVMGLVTFAGIGVASAAPAHQAGIFCPYFQDPTVQYVAHTVCTR